jgi:mannose-1-phosphate guanylyltransferase
MSSNRFVVIMAGGRGERFWPMSREKTPKQLITLIGGKSFLQQAVENVLPLAPIENIFIITNALQAPTVRRQLPTLPRQNIVAEPVGRDTCAAVALGAAVVGKRDSSAVMAVLPADHVIPEVEKFRQVLSDSFEVASTHSSIVTIGIKPNEPATGYGYIHTGAPLSVDASMKTAFFKAEKFVEKPTLEKAVAYVNSGEYRWNAGMFVWSFDTVFKGLEAYQPVMAQACVRWMKAAGTPGFARVLVGEYPGIQKISIDYALMEKAQNVVVADGAFAWDDLGAWPALARHLKADAEDNCAVADFIQVDSARNIVFDARTKHHTPIALVGVSDSILVQTDDAVLLAHKSQAQKIKELVKKLGSTDMYKKLV